jgi:hypothetical protein
MFKYLMNGSSLLAMARFDAESDERAALRASLVKNNTVIEKPTTPVESENEAGEGDDENENEEDKEDEERDEDEEDKTPPDEELTDEEKAAKELEKKAADKIAAKAARKQDRMQRRIDEAVASAKAAKDELAAFRNANPDTKLSEEEVESRAEAKAAERLAAQKVKDLQTEFDNTCERLQKEATKLDPQFYEKIVDISDQFGPIPSFMIGVLDDFDNGAEVLAHITNDDELAEKIWDLKFKPAKMTKELVLISNKLTDAKKPAKKQISKVPDPIAAVKGSRTTGTTITAADTKPENMDNYVAKRRAQMAAKAGR